MVPRVRFERTLEPSFELGASTLGLPRRTSPQAAIKLGGQGWIRTSVTFTGEARFQRAGISHSPTCPSAVLRGPSPLSPAWARFLGVPRLASPNWRMVHDSNVRDLSVAALAGRCLKPLGQPSVFSCVLRRYGGEGGIRTHGASSEVTSVFRTAALSRSATSPGDGTRPRIRTERTQFLRLVTLPFV